MGSSNVLRKQLEEAPMLFWYYSNQLEDYKRKSVNLKLRLWAVQEYLMGKKSVTGTIMSVRISYLAKRKLLKQLDILKKEHGFIRPTLTDLLAIAMKNTWNIEIDEEDKNGI